MSKVRITNHYYKGLIGLTGTIINENELQYSVRLDHGQSWAGIVFVSKEYIDFV